MSTYKNHNSKAKHKSRELLKRCIDRNIGDKGRIKNMATLPADNFIFEGMFNENKWAIHCFEKNKEVWNRGIGKHVGQHYINRDIFTELRKNICSYDVIWLDLCGNLTPKTINSLIPVFQGNSTKKEAIVAITLAKGREVIGKYKEFYGFKDLEDLRNKVFPKMLSDFAKQTGVKCKLLKLHSYKGEGKADMPMNLYIFKLTKN